jgi:hypothetical protein
MARAAELAVNTTRVGLSRSSFVAEKTVLHIIDDEDVDRCSGHARRGHGDANLPGCD